MNLVVVYTYAPLNMNQIIKVKHTVHVIKILAP